MDNAISRKLEQISRTRKWLNESRSKQLRKRSVEEIGSTRWFKQADAAITFDQSTNFLNSYLSQGDHLYLSYQEENTNFMQPPVVNQFNIQPGKEYTFSTAGTKDKEMSVSLVAIFYGKGEKLEERSFPLNQKNRITVLANWDSMRLAIKISGKGVLKLTSIQVEDISVWTTNSFSSSKFRRLPYSNWYIPNNNSISFDNQIFDLNLESDKYIYIPYREGNTNFNDSPQNPIKVDSQKNIAVQFEGEKARSVDVKLFIIFYNKENEKISNEQIALNDQKLIIPPDEAEKIRLALRVAGSGDFRLTTLAVSGRGYWLEKGLNASGATYYNSDFSYLMDETRLAGLFSDNKLLYHEEYQCFESKLVGEQYKYLDYLPDISNDSAAGILAPKPKHYYLFHPVADISDGVRLDLFIGSFRNGKRIGLKQIPFNQQSFILFDEEATDVKVFIRVTGSGIFGNIHLNIDEEEREITNEISLELNKENWFLSGKVVALKNAGNTLLIESEAGSDQRIYTSYKESNNSFGIPPLHHIMPINKGYIYECIIKAQISDGFELLPMLVEYSGPAKLGVHQLKVNANNLIKFQAETTDIRIAFRMSGSGKGMIEQFTIREMQSVPEDSGNIDLVNKLEPFHLGAAKPKPLKKLKMAVIFDEFTTASYKEECELITFGPENWLETLTSNRPDLLMVESAWVGNGGSWNKRVGFYGNENMKPLFSLIKWCNEHNIPTVFWNKEDPVHFNRFIKTAIKFDYIFTTDENMVPEYKENAGHENVFALPFAAQPVIHNPIKIVDKRENKACFAGSYYRHHEERAKDMDRVLDYAAKYGLDIYDRNYEKTQKGLMPNHTFPDRLQPNIKGSLKYYEIDKAYKGYKVMINVNTVKDSPTMFSRRVFEGLACGTPVVSTYAKGIENLFGNLVYISENEEEIDNAFDTLLNSETEYRRKSMLGIRDVLSKHTYTQRLEYICDLVGLPVSHKLPKVTVIAFVSSKEDFVKVLEQFNRQKYENKELYLLIGKFDGYLDIFKNYNTKSIKTFIRSYMHNYQNILEWIETPYLTYFNKNDYYGSNYLLDLMLSTTYTDSDFIGKKAYFEYDRASESVIEQHRQAEYEFVTSLKPSSTIVKTDVFTKESLQEVLKKVEDGLDFSSYLRYGKKLFSSDKFNYLANAYDDNKSTEGLTKSIKQIEI